VPYNRAWFLKRGMTKQEPAFSNSFAFYPWMIDKQYDDLLASTPAMLATQDTEKFHGQSSPEISYTTVTDLDEPLLKILIDRWEARFGGGNPTPEDRALFRSLNMAFHAAQTPFATAGTTYDSGRLVGLWVSAFEILSHPDKGSANMATVLKVLNRSQPKSAPARKTVYDRLNRVRNNYLHGDEIDPAPNLSANRLSNYAPVLYRLMLTEFLGLHRKLNNIPRRGKFWTKRLGWEMGEQMQFERYQEQYEDALDTFLNPQPRRGITHRRRERRVGTSEMLQ
jgi:hypothetical protein